MRCCSSLGYTPTTRSKSHAAPSFTNRCCSGAATVGQTFAWWPLLNTIDVAHAAEALPSSLPGFRTAHLYTRSLNTRFVDKVVRAAQEVQAMDPPADFLIFGGDMAQLLGKIEELEPGVELPKNVTIRKVYIPGSTTGTWIWARSGASCSASPTGPSTTRACALSGSIRSAGDRTTGQRRK